MSDGFQDGTACPSPRQFRRRSCAAMKQASQTDPVGARESEPRSVPQASPMSLDSKDPAAGSHGSGGRTSAGEEAWREACNKLSCRAKPVETLKHQPGENTMPTKSKKPARKLDLRERNRIVLQHLPLVRAIAVRVHESLPVHVDLDDLIHAGILGLFDAVEKYDPSKEVAFSSYAKHRIKGAILDSLRQLDWASRDLRRRHKQVEEATRALTAELQRTPTDEELAQRLGIEERRWRQIMIDLRNVGLISASTRSAPGTDGEELPPPDFPCHPDHHPDRICARQQLREALARAMEVLPERYRKVVLLYYRDELTMKQIGHLMGINESRVSQIHKSALEKMASALQADGIFSSAAFTE